MKIRQKINLVEEMILENPKALSVAVPTFALKALIKNCYESDMLIKKIAAEKARGDYYEQQLKTLEKAVTRKGLGVE